MRTPRPILPPATYPFLRLLPSSLKGLTSTGTVSSIPQELYFNGPLLMRNLRNDDSPMSIPSGCCLTTNIFLSPEARSGNLSCPRQSFFRCRFFPNPIPFSPAYFPGKKRVFPSPDVTVSTIHHAWCPFLRTLSFLSSILLK